MANDRPAALEQPSFFPKRISMPSQKGSAGLFSSSYKKQNVPLADRIEVEKVSSINRVGRIKL